MSEISLFSQVRFPFISFELQEAADKALETIRSEEGIIIEGARLDANYSNIEPRPEGKYPGMFLLQYSFLRVANPTTVLTAES